MGILLDKFDKFIVEHGSAVVRGDHIALLREQLQIAEKQIAKLEKENTDLKTRLASAERKTTPEEFVEFRGALFKRNNTGGYHLTVYCPNCRRVASTIDEHFPYSCNCGWAVEFTPHDLDGIVKQLPT
jgi:hypothetical protein